MRVLFGLCILVIFSLGVNGQNVNPKVNIVHTEPTSEGERVKGIISSDVLLTCYVENKPEDLQVRWDRVQYDKNGKERIDVVATDQSVEDNSKWSIEKPTQFSWRLRIKSLAVSDEGNYTCYLRLTINDNRVEANRTVLAYSPPIIIEEQSSSDMTVKEEDFVPLRCNATGRPIPNIIWRRQGNAILPGGGVRHMGAELNVYEIEYTSSGLYICEAFNDVGYDRRDITLAITHSPKVYPDPSRVGQAVGYQRTLTCHIDANPVPSTDLENSQLWWMSGSSRLPPYNERWEMRVMMGAYNRLTMELVIFRVSDDDYGTYSCYASTNLGQEFGQVELFETDEPQPDKRNAISASSRLTTSGAFVLFGSVVVMVTKTLGSSFLYW